MTTSLNDLLQQDFNAEPSIHTGMMVMDAKSGQVLYQYAGQQYFHPASNTKLFTAIAALLSLGGSYQFVTSLNSQTSIPATGIIPGNLYLKFSGDPSLKNQDLYTLFAALKTSGVKEIQGNIILVDTIFSQDLFPLGVVREDSMWAYGVPASSIIVDENAVNVSFKPHTNKPQIMQVGSGFVRVNANLIWGNDANKKSCIFNVADGIGNTLNLQGCLPPELGGTIGLAIPHPDLYATNLITGDLNTLGVKLDGKILTGDLPENANFVLAQHQSLSLTHLLTTMLKNSDNLYASAITKTMGLKRYQIGSNHMGAMAITDYLAPYQLPHYILEDGAGASTYNLVSPTVMVQLLYHAYQNPLLASFLMSALPILAVDGTLKDFPSASLIKGKVIAKSGTMTGVSNLSGFMTGASGRLLIFSLLIDNTPLSNHELKLFQAKILTDLYQNT